MTSMAIGDGGVLFVICVAFVGVTMGLAVSFRDRGASVSPTITVTAPDGYHCAKATLFGEQKDSLHFQVDCGR